MVDSALRAGGPWRCSDPAVACDGYFEDWGYQESTATLGPTCDGVAREGAIRISPRGAGGDGGLRRTQEDNFR